MSQEDFFQSFDATLPTEEGVFSLETLLEHAGAFSHIAAAYLISGDLELSEYADVTGNFNFTDGINASVDQGGGGSIILASANGASVADSAVEMKCDIYPDGVKEASSTISDVCDGGIPATRQVVGDLAKSGVQLEKDHPLYEAVRLKRLGLDNLSDQAVIDLNKQLGLYDPTQVKESAALMEGTTFTLKDDGSFVIADPQGNPLITVDCQGNVTHHRSISMIDSQPCTGIACVKPPEEAPVTLTESATTAPVVREQVYICADDNGILRPQQVLIFNSVEDAQQFAQNPENFPDSYQDGIKCKYVWIANGEGNVQKLPYETLKDGSIDLKEEDIDAVTLNDGKPNTYSVGSRRIQRYDPLESLTLPDGEKFEKYITGYAGTSNVHAPDGMDYGIDKGEVIFPSAPQELVYDPETGRYVLEDIETSATRTVNTWLREADISSAEWDKLYDMQLPDEFADPSTSVETRANALIEAAAEEGVSLNKEDATELARIITAGQAEDAGFPYIKEEKIFKSSVVAGGREIPLRVAPQRQDGSMITLDEALFGTARSVTLLNRAF